jgi:hypothetical protein
MLQYSVNEASVQPPIPWSVALGSVPLGNILLSVANANARSICPFIRTKNALLLVLTGRWLFPLGTLTRIRRTAVASGSSFSLVLSHTPATVYASWAGCESGVRHR